MRDVLLFRLFGGLEASRNSRPRETYYSRFIGIECGDADEIALRQLGKPNCSSSR